MKNEALHPAQLQNLGFDRYESPQSLDEAIALLAHHKETARLIAGGTDLLLEMERGVRPGVTTLIDVSRIPGIDFVHDDGGTIRLGPGLTHAAAIGSQALVLRGLPLVQACLEVGSPQLRNRATIVGNLVTASPANDTISALMALGAQVTMTNLAGSRTVDLTGFYEGVRKTVLNPGEMVTDVSFPGLSERRRGVFVKLGLRRAQAISLVHLSCVVEMDGDVVSAARIAVGSVAPVVILAEETASSLLGERLDGDVIDRAAQAAVSECRPIDDIRSTAEYRAAMVEVMLRRALKTLRDGTERDMWPGRPVTLSTDEGPHTSLSRNPHHSDGDPLRATVNGRQVETRGRVAKTLLEWLRDDAGVAIGVGLTGTKEGCGEGECGACTVFLDGDAVMACLVPAPAADGSHVITIEGLADGDGRLHPLQEAFIDRGAVQCGFCTPGFVMAGAKLIEEFGSPTVDEIRAGLAGNLCRCTGYYKIIEAVQEAVSLAERAS